MTEDRLLYLIALPIILVMVFGEFWYRQRKNDKRNKLVNLSSNLLCGLIDRLFFLFFGIVQYQLMVWISHYAVLPSLSNKVLNGIVVFLIVDFVWYLYHRAAHHVKLFWAFHHTHHQTDDFNLSLGLRVSFLQQIIRTFFWLPIALLGFDPMIILIAIFFQSFYQFFIHTELFDFPVFMRFMFITPQSHKLHHSNQNHLKDQNFGGVLTIWDRLFKTFKSAYTEKNITLKSDETIQWIAPYHAYFAPFFKLFSPNLSIGRNEKEVTNKEDEKIGKRMFFVFLILLIPSLILILFSEKMEFSYILIGSVGVILITFFSVHFLIKIIRQ